MKTLVKGSLEKGISYAEYQDQIQSLLDEGSTSTPAKDKPPI